MARRGARSERAPHARVRTVPIERPMSAKEAAAYLETSRKSVYYAVSCGSLKAGRPIKKLLFDPREIRRFDGQDVPDWAQ